MNFSFRDNSGTPGARAARITLAYFVACVILVALVRCYDGMVYQDDTSDTATNPEDVRVSAT